MRDQGIIFVLSGYSGVGKNTIINEARKYLSAALKGSKTKVKYIPSCTTRPMRKHQGETEGNPYHFMSQQEFVNRIANDGFVEYNEIHSNLYGTPKKEYLDAVREGHIVIKDMDVEGAVSMKNKLNAQVILIFVDPPSLEELKSRLVNRGDEIDNIATRLKRVDLESAFRPNFAHQIVNDNLNYAVAELLNIINHYTGVFTKEYDIKSLIPTQRVHGMSQDTVFRYRNLYKIPVSVPDKPYVYTMNGNTFILNGHHRVLGAYASGLRKISAVGLPLPLRNFNVQGLHTIKSRKDLAPDIYDWEDTLANLETQQRA